MNLTDKIGLFYREKYGLECIDAERVSKAIAGFEYNPSLNKVRRYFDIYKLAKHEGNLNEELGFIFIRYSDFPSDLDLLSFGKENDNEKSIQIFFKRHALKEETIARQIRNFCWDSSKIFLRCALEHILFCENPNLWKEPDNSINHLKALSRVATRLAYLEENIDDKISLFELNYGVLLKKGDRSRADYDEGFHYFRRLLECCSNLALYYFKKEDANKSGEYLNLALSYLDKLKNTQVEFDKLDPNLAQNLRSSLDNITKLRILINNQNLREAGLESYPTA